MGLGQDTWGNPASPREAATGEPPSPVVWTLREFFAAGPVLGPRQESEEFFLSHYKRCIKADSTRSSQAARGSSPRTRIFFIPGRSSLKAQHSSKVKALCCKEPIPSGSQGAGSSPRAHHPISAQPCRTGFEHTAHRAHCLQVSSHLPQQVSPTISIPSTGEKTQAQRSKITCP